MEREAALEMYRSTSIEYQSPQCCRYMDEIDGSLCRMLQSPHCPFLLPDLSSRHAMAHREAVDREVMGTELMVHYNLNHDCRRREIPVICS
jgi:hypothetical protein